MVSGDFFSAIGVAPACGRLLDRSDEKAHAAVAIVSAGFSNRRFGGSCAAAGQTIYVKGVALRVVGVAQTDFAGVEGQPTDVWIPLQVRPELNAWGSNGVLHFGQTTGSCIKS